MHDVVGITMIHSARFPNSSWAGQTLRPVITDGYRFRTVLSAISEALSEFAVERRQLTGRSFARSAYLVSYSKLSQYMTLKQERPYL